VAIEDATAPAISASARFFKSEAAGSVILLFCTLAALAWANSRWSALYFQILNTKIGFSWNDLNFALSAKYWINDCLMALFFFVVGLEIKREIVVGHLSTVKQAVLPVAAAIGGMLLPAVIYSALNTGGEGAKGWGVPMATDIAFALGILAVLGPRVPPGLKVFLAAVAIADDLGAVLVIALFYTERILLAPLLAALGLLAVLALVTRRQIGSMLVYVLLALGVWLAVFASGVHATVAGILVAMVVPVRARIDPKRFFGIAHGQLARLEACGFREAVIKLDSDQIDALEDLNEAASDSVPAGPAFERGLHPVTAYFILPLFAFFNAGVAINYQLLHALSHPVGLGVILGLVIGKQTGIAGASWIVVRCGLAETPPGLNWRQIYGAAILGGIGFTMALFISDLATNDTQLLGFLKIAILVASAVSAAGGYLLLRRSQT
jgi:NhaA family Na+:H+ antiporter